MPHNIITITADNISNVIGELIFDPANDDHGLMRIDGCGGMGDE